MAKQYSTSLRNALLETYESHIDTSPVLEIRSGTPPANCAASDTGDLLASIALPSDWMGDAANGAKAKAGTWQDSAADDTGTAGHYRLKASGGTVHEQGTVTATGGGGDMTLDNVSLAAGQSVTITSWNVTMGGA